LENEHWLMPGLGNAFDKEYWSPQGIPQDGRNGKIFVSYQW